MSLLYNSSVFRDRECKQSYINSFRRDYVVTSLLVYIRLAKKIPKPTIASVRIQTMVTDRFQNLFISIIINARSFFPEPNINETLDFYRYDSLIDTKEAL